MHSLRKDSEFLSQRSVAAEERRSKEVSVLGGEAQLQSETGKHRSLELLAPPSEMQPHMPMS